MKRILIICLLVLGLTAAYGFTQMGGHGEMMDSGQPGDTMGHGQIMGKMMGIMKQMSGMMDDMSEMMTDVSADRIQLIKGIMKEMSEHMIDMSKMMKKGTVSENEMRALQDKMRNTQERMYGMTK